MTCSLHVNLNHQAALPAGKATLKADTGKYLARCNGCGPAAYPDTAAIHETNPANPWAIWGIEDLGDKVAFKSDSGKYLARCNNCWNKGAYPDSAFVHVSTPTGNPWALWTPEKLANGKWALKSDSGKYLSRCNGCVTGGAYPDFAFVHLDNSNAPYSQWTIDYVFPIGRVSIQSDTGKYLARCNGCGPAAYPDSAAVHETNPANSWAIWNAESVGNQIAFKSDSGKYLSRCNNCWNKGAYPDSAFVHVSTPTDNPWALWTPERLANGKWALKSDSGKYLSRCNGCVTGGAYPDFAFVHLDNANAPYSQWTINNV